MSLLVRTASGASVAPAVRAADHRRAGPGGVAARLLSSYLYGLGASDPVTFAAAISVFLAVSAVASYLPARSAANIDPSTALRVD